jgi:branched-subunit amino acid aminotransferase/4-amino-4-deoxychorismate lyase
MPDTVWVNGRFVTREEARVSAFDAGVLHGVGLFETMLATPLAGDESATRGRVFRIHRHMERLERSARTLGLTDALKVRALQELVEHVVERSEITKTGPARARLTITGGDLNLLSSTGQGPTDPTVIISVQPATNYPPEMFDRGVRGAIASARANPLGPDEGHKTLNYWWRLRELRAASAKGCAEAIVLQVTNHLCGGTVSNLFIVNGGSLLTPTARGEEERLGGEHLPCPVLPGITREAIIEAASQAAIGCEKRLVTIDDVLDADEVFLTNSSWGVLPVIAVEAKPIGPGKPGPITRRLRERWKEMVSGEP